MSEYQLDTREYDSAEADTMSAPTGEIEEYTQITVKDTGWSEEEKERMRQAGYDDMDIIRAWYS